ncbi:Prefoldin subunit 6 [Vanrija pseudolonga]|uniref:Prefoldin subunit 6 n=1 Tax=Vanrija pseudolonga TaxID=143232 RepID=A0AAF0Y2H1_9TREE|nr:Prefoldin subunit 6 [Vanrija pseudolonga]
MADKKIAAIQAKLQESSRDFQKLESDMAGTIEARQRLDAQLSENQQEFEGLKAHNTVFKLIGPGLVPQDQAEARANVQKRLEFIKSEITRVEKQIKDQDAVASKKKDEIMALQREFQALQPPSAVPAK